MSHKQKAAASVILTLLITCSFVFGLFWLPAPKAPSSSSDIVQITHVAATRIGIAPSPNGRYIAYSSNQTGSFAIWLSTINGAQLTKITQMSGDQITPEWSPVGNTIAFIWKHGSFSDICLTEAYSEKNQVCVTTDKHVQDYSWSPNGQIIAYDDSVENDIHLYYLSTGLTTLFEFDNGTAMYPAFGLDSNVLYFSASNKQGSSYIWNATISGDNPKRLSWIGADTMPQVNPAGNEILFLANMTGRQQPWLIDLKSGVNEYLFVRPDLEGLYTFPQAPNVAPGTIPRWSPDGSQILMISGINGTAGSLYLVTLGFPVPSSELPTPLLTAGTKLNVFNPISLNCLVSSVQWIPDGNGIALLSISSRSDQILVIQNGPPAKIGYGG